MKILKQMSEEFDTAQNEMRTLLERVRSAILASVDSKAQPLSSYAPVWVDDDRRFHVYISSLAKHTSQIKRSGLASVMIIEDESEADNLFARKRLTVDCRVEVVDRNTEDWEATMGRMEKRLGETVSSLKGLTDFDLIRLIPSEGRLVLGFGRAYRLFGNGLREIGYIGGGGHRSK